MNENYKTGVSILDVLGVVLIVLKCLNQISLKWLWVLAPFWIQVVIGVVIVVALGISKARFGRKYHW